MTICTEGAASMTGKHSKVVARIRELVPNIIQTYCNDCMIHREALAARHLGQSMKEVFVFICQSCKFNQNSPTIVSIVFITLQ